MSSRQVRRLQVAPKQAAEGKDLIKVEQEEEDGETAGILKSGKSSAHFNLLADSDNDSSSDEDGTSKSVHPPGPEGITLAHGIVPNPMEVKKPSKTARSQVTKSRGIQRPVPTASDDEWNSLQPVPETIPLTMLDRLLLLPNAHCLNADAELVRVFGRLQRADAGGSGHGPVGGLAPGRGGQRGGQRAKHCGLFVTADPPHTAQWPFVPAPTAVSGGFSMQCPEGVKSGRVGVEQQSTNFDIVTAPEYNRLCIDFESASSSGDPNLLVAWASHNLYCLPAVLALSDYYRTVRQPEAASVHIRRALYLLEACLHPLFKPWETICRIVPSASSACHLLHTVLFRAQASAARAGAVETSFELCRLLLQLAPPNTDPNISNDRQASDAADLRVALVADTAALRAGQDAWIISMTGAAGNLYVCTLGGSSLPLVMLPGWALARARALFRLQEKYAEKQRTVVALTSAGPLPAIVARAKEKRTWLFADSTFLSGPATWEEVVAQHALRKSALDPATRTLLRTLLVFPHVLIPLLTALGIKQGDKGLTAVLGDTTGAGVMGMGAGDDSSAAYPRAGQSAPDCAWSPLFIHKLFSGPYKEYNKVRAGEISSEDSNHWPYGLEHLVTIAARRHSQVWRSAPALRWLHYAATLACGCYDAAWGPGSEAGAELDGEMVRHAAEAHTARALLQEVFYDSTPGGPDAVSGSYPDPNVRGESAALRQAIAHYATSHGPLTDYTDEAPDTMEAELADQEGMAGVGQARVGGHTRARRPGACTRFCLWIAEASGHNPFMVFLASLIPGYVIYGPQQR